MEQDKTIIQDNLLAVLQNPCCGLGFTWTVKFSQTLCSDLNIPTSLVKNIKFTSWFTKAVYYHFFLTRNWTYNSNKLTVKNSTEV